MADQDKTADPDAVEIQAPANLSSANAGWLKFLFGDAAPADLGKSIHRSKKIAISLSQDMVGDLATIRQVEIIGLPSGAKISDGEDLGGGIWRIVAPDDSPIVIEPSPENSGPVNLSLKVTGEEAIGGDVVSVMAGVRVFFPPKTPGDAELGLRPAVQPEPPPAPAPEPEPEPEAVAEAAPKPVPEAAPEPEAIAEAAPESEPEAAPAPGNPAEDKRTGAGTIVVRLGGAPEFGDPRYGISVDDHPAVNGSLDWGLGLPALEVGGEAALFWRTRSIDWDFKDGLPDRLSINLENPDGGLLVGFVEVDGFRIAGDGPFATPSGGWRNVPAVGGYRLWDGALVFDIAAAFAAPRRPLIIRLSAEDMVNPTMLSELQAFRRYLQGQPGSEPVGSWAAAFAENGSVTRWNDLKALGPDGAEVDIEAPRRPLIIRLGAADVGNDAVLAELAQISRYLRGERDSKTDMVSKIFTDLDSSKGDWDDLVVLDPDGAPVVLYDNDDDSDDAEPAAETDGDAPAATAAAEALARLERVERSPEERDRDAGARLKSGFFAEQLDRAFAAVGMRPPGPAPIGVARDEGEQLRRGFFGAVLEIGMEKIRRGIDAVTAAEPPVVVAEPEPMAIPLSPMSRPTALDVRQGFFTARLKNALEHLRASRLAAASAAKPAAPRPATPAVPWQVGAQLSSDFFSAMIDRALGRIDQSPPAAMS